MQLQGKNCYENTKSCSFFFGLNCLALKKFYEEEENQNGMAFNMINGVQNLTRKINVAAAINSR